MVLGPVDITGNWYVPPLSFRNNEVVDWAQPIILTLWPVASGGPLEVKTNQTVWMVEHSLGAVFWSRMDFVGQRKIVVRDLLEFGHLPHGKYLLLPVGPVGQDITTHFICPCGRFITSGTQ